jgi:trehalose utilization protein
LDDPECGLTQEVLDDTDVLIWWGHMKHNEVPDEVVTRVKESVLKGMGIIFLHSAHHSKPFRALMGTSCNLSWREDGDSERVWVCNPAHPIAQGLGRYFEIEHDETYAEPFGIPEPDETVFIGWYEGGEVFRSGCTWRRENGKVFYFQPGHETFGVYYNPAVQTVIRNAVRWVKSDYRIKELTCPNVKKPGQEDK